MSKGGLCGREMWGKKCWNSLLYGFTNRGWHAAAGTRSDIGQPQRRRSRPRTAQDVTSIGTKPTCLLGTYMAPDVFDVQLVPTELSISRTSTSTRKNIALEHPWNDKDCMIDWGICWRTNTRCHRFRTPGYRVSGNACQHIRHIEGG